MKRKTRAWLIGSAIIFTALAFFMLNGSMLKSILDFGADMPFCHSGSIEQECIGNYQFFPSGNSWSDASVAKGFGYKSWVIDASVGPSNNIQTQTKAAKFLYNLRSYAENNETLILFYSSISVGAGQTHTTASSSAHLLLTDGENYLIKDECSSMQIRSEEFYTFCNGVQMRPQGDSINYKGVKIEIDPDGSARMFTSCESQRCLKGILTKTTKFKQGALIYWDLYATAYRHFSGTVGSGASLTYNQNDFSVNESLELWKPSASDVCSGIQFTQGSNYGRVRSQTGLKECANSEDIKQLQEKINSQQLSVQEMYALLSVYANDTLQLKQILSGSDLETNELKAVVEKIAKDSTQASQILSDVENMRDSWRTEFEKFRMYVGIGFAAIALLLIVLIYTKRKK